MNKSREKWVYIGIPKEMAKIIDKIIEKDKYPMGKYRSRNHFIIENLKIILEKYQKELKIQNK